MGLIKNIHTNEGITPIDYESLANLPDIPAIVEQAGYMKKDDQTYARSSTQSEVFSSEKEYNIGDYCIYENKLYKFTETKVAGEWDSTKVTPTTIGAELKAHTAAISEQNVNKENKLTFDVSKVINFMSGIAVYHTNCKRYGKLCVGYFNCMITKEFTENSVIATVPFTAESWTFIPLKNAVGNYRGSISSGSNEIKTEFTIPTNTEIVGEFIWFTND